jgi:hypothetical protein
MRAVLVLVAVFGPLAVPASNFGRNLEGGIHDDPAAPAPDSNGDRTALYEQWPQLGSIPVNRTEGLIRRGKRQPNKLLEARQTDVSVQSKRRASASASASAANLFSISDIGLLGSRLHSRVSYYRPLSVLRPKIPHLFVHSTSGL